MPWFQPSLRSRDGGGVVDVTFDYAGVVDQARLTAHQVVDEEGRTIAVPGDVGRDGVIAGDIASGRRNRIPYGIVVPDEVLRGRRASAGKPGLHLPLDAHPVRPAIPAGRAGDELQAVGAHELRSEELLEQHELGPVARGDGGKHHAVVRDI